MSNLEECKTNIKDIKAKIKSIAKQQLAKPNPNNDVLSNLYSKILLEQEVELRGLKIRERVTNTGISYDEWHDWAMSLYSITQLDDDTYKVDSKARDWDMSWVEPDHISAEEKIEQLCGYKMYDRSRDRGDMKLDLIKAGE